jgi:hypothetical protein
MNNRPVQSHAIDMRPHPPMARCASKLRQRMAQRLRLRGQYDGQESPRDVVMVSPSFGCLVTRDGRWLGGAL